MPERVEITRRGRATRCTPSSARSPTRAWLSRARSHLDRSTVLCETSGTATGKWVDQRRGHRLRRHWRIRVSLWLNGFRRCCGGRSSTLRTRCPNSYRLVLDELGPLVVELDVDGELFSLRGGAPARGGGRCGEHGRRPDRHLPSGDPRRARRQGRAWARPSKRARSPCGARSTTCCVRTTPCSRTSTPRSGRRRSPGCWPHSGREAIMTEAIRPTPRRRRASDAARSRSWVAASPGSPPLTNWRSAASMSRCTNCARTSAAGSDERAGRRLPARQARRPRRLPVLDGRPVHREPR